ncbi:MAG TPA: relaxase/mobilization nuclease domain-containing protein [Puia sp.]|nr:relaxase/mobilization nuclease domain-containing protein [Puia sp.]HVU97761.1 relaxase/mobilization nuclease domain-containing protein [Puia sp.]
MNERDRNIRTNTLHLSINFPPEEVLSDEKMRLIATDYMKRIGFGEQPFLVYRHADTLHQHFHIVTTSIEADGNHIDMNFLGRDKSEPARKAIEQEFGLIAAESRKRKGFVLEGASPLLPAEYGKQETKHAITNIVGTVVNSYKFASLDEFNIILRQFNVIADWGLPGSRRRHTGGLVYSLLDAEGRKTGVPIKASDIYKKPLLKLIQRKCAGNQVKKAGLAVKTENTVTTLLRSCQTASELASRLKKRGIRLHFDQDKLGVLQSVHFVDHFNKTVFSNGDLNISLNDFYRLRAGDVMESSNRSQKVMIRPSGGDHAPNSTDFFGLGSHSTAGTMHILFHQTFAAPGPGPSTPKKKKRRKRGPSH